MIEVQCILRNLPCASSCSTDLRTLQIVVACSVLCTDLRKGLVTGSCMRNTIVWLPVSTKLTSSVHAQDERALLSIGLVLNNNVTTKAFGTVDLPQFTTKFNYALDKNITSGKWKQTFSMHSRER